ncbi:MULTISPECIES: Sec-independent protein translocase subunit TatA [Bacteria]|jgi:sec-independent protein translocase protein TatA
MLGNLTGWHLLILLAVILLLFGAARLPALARSMGQSARAFRGEMKAMKEEDAASDTAKADQTAAPYPPSATGLTAPPPAGSPEAKP